MNAVTVIGVWGIVAIGSAVAGGLIATAKNRDHSWWAAWSFMLPPMVLILLFLPAVKGPRPRRPTLDEQDREHEPI